MEKIRLMLRIERTRKRLNEVAAGGCLSDRKVVKMSRKLDQLLNMYQACS